MFRYIAEDIAFLLIKNKIVDIEKRDECVYGAEVLLLNLSNVLTALIISILTKSMLHFAAYALIFVPLRIFIGGFHTKTSESCYLISSTIYALTVLCFKLMPELYTNTPAIITLVVLVVSIVLFAPVEHKNNLLSEYERKRNRLISIVLTVIDSLIFIALYFLSVSTATSVMIFMTVNSVLMLIGLLINRTEKKIGGVNL